MTPKVGPLRDHRELRATRRFLVLQLIAPDAINDWSTPRRVEGADRQSLTDAVLDAGVDPEALRQYTEQVASSVAFDVAGAIDEGWSRHDYEGLPG